MRHLMPNFQFFSWLLKLVVHKSRSKNIHDPEHRLKTTALTHFGFYMYPKCAYQAVPYLQYGLYIKVKVQV